MNEAGEAGEAGAAHVSGIITGSGAAGPLI